MLTVARQCLFENHEIIEFIQNFAPQTDSLSAQGRVEPQNEVRISFTSSTQDTDQETNTANLITQLVNEVTTLINYYKNQYNGCHSDPVAQEQVTARISELRLFQGNIHRFWQHPSYLRDEIDQHFLDINDEENVVHLAICRGNKTLLDLLYQLGANLNTKTQDVLTRTPLHIAIDNDQIELAYFLIKNGADIHATKSSGDNALHIAINNDHIELAYSLIAKDADIHATNSDGDKPLHIALNNGHIELAKYLIANGADIHATNKNGNNPLHCAAAQGLDDSQLLDQLNTPQNRGLTNYYGKTPYDLAYANSFHQIADKIYVQDHEIIAKRGINRNFIGYLWRQTINLPSRLKANVTNAFSRWAQPDSSPYSASLQRHNEETQPSVTALNFVTPSDTNQPTNTAESTKQPQTVPTTIAPPEQESNEPTSDSSTSDTRYSETTTTSASIINDHSTTTTETNRPESSANEGESHAQSPRTPPIYPDYPNRSWVWWNGQPSSQTNKSQQSSNKHTRRVTGAISNLNFGDRYTWGHNQSHTSGHTSGNTPRRTPRRTSSFFEKSYHDPKQSSLRGRSRQFGIDGYVAHIRDNLESYAKGDQGFESVTVHYRNLDADPKTIEAKPGDHTDNNQAESLCEDLSELSMALKEQKVEKLNIQHSEETIGEYTHYLPTNSNAHTFEASQANQQSFKHLIEEMVYQMNIHMINIDDIDNDHINNYELKIKDNASVNLQLTNQELAFVLTYELQESKVGVVSNDKENIANSIMDKLQTSIHQSDYQLQQNDLIAFLQANIAQRDEYIAGGPDSVHSLD